MNQELDQAHDKEADHSGLEFLDMHRVAVLTKTREEKRARFLSLLKSRYGYSNDKAVDEIERILKQFHSVNSNLSNHRMRMGPKYPSADR